ncbi:MAG: glutamyl-tRNA reductase [Nocardioidaceae bacterium]
MSILVVGTSHRSAPAELLEQLAVDVAGATKLRAAALETGHVNEVLVLATCNRLEIYADVDRFHGSVEDLTALLVDRATCSPEDVIPALYVHYDAGAVAHLFSVAAGLESMVVGESQILGQVRDALRAAQSEETVGPSLNALFQQGLRVGKRAHAETGIDRAGQSVVSVALEQAAAVIGDVAGARVCVVGAGSIAALAAASVRRADAGDIVVVSRTLSNAQRVAARVDGRAVDIEELPTELTNADVLISCTGATGVVVPAEMIACAHAARVDDRPMVVLDLALPHDVDPEVGKLSGITLIPLASLAKPARDNAYTGTAVEAAKEILDEEVTAFAAAREAARLAPTVVALRTMATAVVAAELDRLFGRLATVTPNQQAEIAESLRRVADKLIHEPTVRVKQLAGRAPEASYADALAELFALNPASVDAVTGIGEAERL